MPAYAPRVSVMIPTYNQAQYLREAIVSALNQDYQNLEIIVCDDCSTDNTSEVMKEFLHDRRITFVVNPFNVGKAANYRNLLCKHASGEWVIMLDSDDYFIDRQFISTAIREVGNKDGIVAVIAGYMISDPLEEHSYVPAVNTRIMNGYELFLDFKKVPFGHASTIYRRSIALEIGFYRFDIESDDYESLLRMFLHGSVILLDRVVYVWRKHGSNISVNADVSHLLKNVAFIDEPYAYALSLGYDQKSLSRWRTSMLVWYFGAYVSKNIELLRRGLLCRAEAIRNIHQLVRYVWSREKKLLFRETGFMIKLISFLILPPRTYVSVASMRRKVRLGSRYRKSEKK